MNCFDFDKTIYNGDSTTDFFFYLLKTRPYLLVFTPWFLIVSLLYVCKLLPKKEYKQSLFFFIIWFKNVDKIVDKFWSKNANKIANWYSEMRTADDVVVSASLDFIIKPVLALLNVDNVIATEFNLKTGKIIGKNCYGEQKVIAFKDKFKKKKPEVYYSDSMSDMPMMKYCGCGYLVKDEKLTKIEINK